MQYFFSLVKEWVVEKLGALKQDLIVKEQNVNYGLQGYMFSK